MTAATSDWPQPLSPRLHEVHAQAHPELWLAFANHGAAPGPVPAPPRIRWEPQDTTVGRCWVPVYPPQPIKPRPADVWVTWSGWQKVAVVAVLVLLAAGNLRVAASRRRWVFEALLWLALHNPIHHEDEQAGRHRAITGGPQ